MSRISNQSLVLKTGIVYDLFSQLFRVWGATTGASEGHPFKCEGTQRVSLPHIEPSLWNLGEGRWGQKNIQNTQKNKSFLLSENNPTFNLNSIFFGEHLLNALGALVVPELVVGKHWHWLFHPAQLNSIETNFKFGAKPNRISRVLVHWESYQSKQFSKLEMIKY